MQGLESVCDNSNSDNEHHSRLSQQHWCMERETIFFSERPFANLSREECFRTYSSHLVSTYGNLILLQNGWRAMPARVVSTVSVNPTVGSLEDGYPSNDWIHWCNYTHTSTSDSLELIASNPTKWTPDNSDTPNYYLAEAVKDNCKWQFSLEITTAVIIYNVMKLAYKAFILFRCNVTIGNAISVFLQSTDPEAISSHFPC